MIIDGLCLNRYIGQMVTVYVTAGGLAGSGFTGILASFNETSLKLVCRMGSAPSCPIGSGCVGYEEQYGNCNEPYNFTLGSICEIPLRSIVAFTHNSI